MINKYWINKWRVSNNGLYGLYGYITVLDITIHSSLFNLHATIVNHDVTESIWNELFNLNQYCTKKWIVSSFNNRFYSKFFYEIIQYSLFNFNFSHEFLFQNNII